MIRIYLRSCAAKVDETECRERLTLGNSWFRVLVAGRSRLGREKVEMSGLGARFSSPSRRGLCEVFPTVARRTVTRCTRRPVPCLPPAWLILCGAKVF